MTFFSHQLQSYNYNCTVHPFQLQIRFYNCRNCDQLHVKICPGHLPVTIYNTIFSLRKFTCIVENYFGNYIDNILTLAKIVFKAIFKILSQNTFQKYF